jgi:hypothetical protein
MQKRPHRKQNCKYTHAQHIKARRCPLLTLKPSLRDLRIQQLQSTESKKMSRFTCPSEKRRCRCPDTRRSLSSCTSPLGPTAREEAPLRQERSRRNKKNTEGFAAAAATKSNDPGNQSFQIRHRTPREQPRWGRIWSRLVQNLRHYC